MLVFVVVVKNWKAALKMRPNTIILQTGKLRSRQVSDYLSESASDKARLGFMSLETYRV